MKIQLKKLNEQVIVITGASSGIGLATARKAAKRGARLVLCARNDDALKQISDELNNAGAQTVYVAADVADEQTARALAATAIEKFGRIDTWINNAGIGIFGKNQEVSTADMRRLFDINFWGVVHGSLVAAAHMKTQGGGAIINVGSEVSDRGVPLQGIYSASKHAVKGFTDSLRVELEEEGVPVSVSLIKPASIDTMFVAHAKNYMDTEPRLPPPIYAPDVVASALLFAAENPVRDMYAGGAAKLMGAGAYYMPRIVDQGMKRFLYRFQKSGQAPRDRDDNSLYAPKSDLLERSGVGGRTRELSVYTSAATHPVATRALVLIAGVALATAWRSSGGLRSGVARNITAPR